VILEDRRIRMVYWISEIIHKPVDRFKNPKLVDETIDNEKRKNMKSAYFTLNRTIPLSILNQKKTVSHVKVISGRRQ
jgi:hypothetical protein